jgi:hypothetical protein
MQDLVSVMSNFQVKVCKYNMRQNCSEADCPCAEALGHAQTGAAV